MFKKNLINTLISSYFLMNFPIFAMENNSLEKVVPQLANYFVEKKFDLLYAAKNTQNLLLMSLADHSNSLATAQEVKSFLLNLSKLEEHEQFCMSSRAKLSQQLLELCQHIPPDCLKDDEMLLKQPFIFSPIKLATFSPTGTLLATADENDTVYVWSLENGKCLKIFPHNCRVWSVAFSPNNKMLATAGVSSRIRIWSLESQQRIHTIKDVNNKTMEYGFNYWERESYKGDKKKDGNWSYVTGISNLIFSPDSMQIAVSIGNESSVWSLRESKLLEWKENRFFVKNIAFDAQGKLRILDQKDSEVILEDKKLSAVVVNNTTIKIIKYAIPEKDINNFSYWQQIVALGILKQVIHPNDSHKINETYQSFPHWLKRIHCLRQGCLFDA